ncbi:MAG: HAD family hydrolase [Spirochaetia bacterium]|jgi:putative hydrolase of the HAD superfamily|nr:HAD family hydrolase [Spirochaetia bacterium]
MTNVKIDVSKIDFIFFDKGGTLSYQEPHEDGGVAAAKKIMDFIGYTGDASEFRKMLKERDKKYKAWSLESCYEDTVEDMCVKWLFHDAPDMKKVKDNADEIIRMTSYVKGERIMHAEAAPLVKTLKERGYRVGLISNTVSPTMVPDELKAAGFFDDLEVVVMSSVERLRKPDPAIFRLACKRAGVAPEKCVYIGDAPNRDVEGPRKAGFAGIIIISGKNYNPESDKGPMREPDVVVENLTELYNLFPDRRG